MFNEVLVVCTGNICRSPMAEALLRAGLPEAKNVTSAGTSALVGHPASTNAIRVCAENGLDISAHRARQVGPVILRSVDLVLALDASHIAGVCAVEPNVRGKTFLLGHWLSGKEVEDPYQQDLAAFEHAFEHIQAGVQEWIKRL